MNIKKKKFKFFLLGLCFSVTFIQGQNYDYHKEESPAISWNGTQMFDARMLAAGGVSFLASRPFAAVINPALLPKGGKFFLGLSFEYMHHEAFQYWGVNQGIYIEPEAFAAHKTGLSGLTFSVSRKGVRLSAGWYVPEFLTLPDFDFDEKYWRYTGTFSGRENTFFAAAAVSPGAKIDVGFKVDVIRGKRHLQIDEYYKYYVSIGYPADSYLLIRRTEHHDLTCIIPAAGVVFNISPSWKLGAAVVYPLDGKAERTLSRVFDNQYEPPTSERYNCSDTLFRPAKIHFATLYTSGKRDNPSSGKISAAAEISYISWSGYRYIFFSEEIPRDMRNCLVLALGFEYGIYRPHIDTFLRAGYRFDPQPVVDPKFSLHAFTLGTGCRQGKITADIGFAYYLGPSAILSQRFFLISGTLSIKL